MLGNNQENFALRGSIVIDSFPQFFELMGAKAAVSP